MDEDHLKMLTTEAYTREQLRRKRRLNWGDVVIYGGWIFSALILIVWATTAAT